jgi:hypothetical protein
VQFDEEIYLKALSGCETEVDEDKAHWEHDSPPGSMSL